MLDMRGDGRGGAGGWLGVQKGRRKDDGERLLPAPQLPVAIATWISLIPSDASSLPANRGCCRAAGWVHLLPPIAAPRTRITPGQAQSCSNSPLGGVFHVPWGWPSRQAAVAERWRGRFRAGCHRDLLNAGRGDIMSNCQRLPGPPDRRVQQQC